MSRLFRFPSLLSLSVLWFSAAAGGMPPTGKALVNALRSGGYVIVMRHASSPGLRPNADEANADNVRRERQLDEDGRVTARAMGDALRSLRIPIGQVLSSPTYRAQETLRMAQLGPVQTYPELGDGGESMRGDPTYARGEWIRTHVGVLPSQGTNTLIVTHYPNVKEAFPAEVKGLDDGEALIFKPDGHGGAKLFAQVKIGEWPQLPTRRMTR